MKRRLCAVLTLSMVAAVSVYAQDRIAVIDTVVPKGMDMGVVIPVTEKIMEEFVRSKLFIVLDRAFISKTLSEQEFSISDLTSGDSKTLATIGGFLQSNYIVVSTVQQLDKTFFLSAKMIEVKSGVIMAQTSVDRTGSIAVLIDMAAELGRKLVTAATGQEVPATSTVKPTQATPPAQTTNDTQAVSPPPAIEKARPKPTRFSSIAAEFGVGTTLETAGTSWGFSGIFPVGFIYASVGGIVVNTESYIEEETLTTQALDLYAGLGLDFPVGPVLLYAGPRIGVSMLSASFYDEYGNDIGSLVYAGLGFGLEFGADLRLGVLDIGIRYGSIAGTLTNIDDDSYTLDYTNGALTLRAGIAF